LTIFETSPIPEGDEPSWDGFPPGAVEEVAIGDTTGIFVRGAIVDEVYDPDAGLSVTWETGGMRISIRFMGTVWNPERLEKEQMIAIAESLR
jgi:hypothetical protein